MDFFEEQELARKRTWRLGLLFALAVIVIVLVVYGLFVGLLYMGAHDELREAAAAAGQAPGAWLTWWHPQIFLWSTTLTLGVILLGTLYKMAKLSRGGAAVALALGGRRVDPSTTNFEERRLLNIVEEMAIASGVPVPDVFLLDSEPGINAFAAGFTTSDAVIGVTRGTAQLLDRQELQGVIAHEFSHILHGDMKINLRAMGLLHGVFLIALIGRWIMEAALRGSGRARGGVFIGFAIFVIGSLGLFFGRLIQAAISRQREVLADASAVQFTRDPAGLAGALKKIGGLSDKSFVLTPAAEEASHMFFGEAIKRFVLFEGMMRTHPELNERIRKLEPQWDGTFGEVLLPSISQPPPAMASADQAQAAAAIAPLASVQRAPSVPVQQRWSPAMVEDAVEHIGNPTEQEVAYAHTLHAGLPPSLVKAAHKSHSAQALVFGLLVGEEQQVRNAQIGILREKTDPDTAELALRCHMESSHCSSAEKIALVDMTLPALRHMSKAEYERFSSVVGDLIRADDQIDLFEYALSRIIRRHLGRIFEGVRESPLRYRALKPLVPDATVLLSALARSGSNRDDEISHAFEIGIEALNLRAAGSSLLGARECGLKQVDQALKRYDASSPKLKKNLMTACALVVMADAQVTDREAELLRAIGDAIDVPMPPFVRA